MHKGENLAVKIEIFYVYCQPESQLDLINDYENWIL